jgi:hypothetical protein
VKGGLIGVAFGAPSFIKTPGHLILYPGNTFVSFTVEPNFIGCFGIGSRDATIKILKDDSTSATNTLFVFGYSYNPGTLFLNAGDTTIDFGEVKVDTTVSKLLLMNPTSSHSALTYETRLNPKDSIFSASAILDNCYSIKGQGVLRFRPRASQPYRDTLYVTTDTGISFFRVVLKGRGIASSVAANASQETFLVYPNPVTNSASFSIPKSEGRWKVELFDALGRKRREYVGFGGKALDRYPVEVNGLGPGTYTAMFTTGETSKRTRFSVLR